MRAFPRLLRRTPAAVFLIGLAACQAPDLVEIPETKDWNLRQLHDRDGSHRRRAAVLSDLEYFMRFGIGGLLSNSREALQQVEPRRIKRVEDVVLRNLIALTRFDSSDARVATMQAEWTTWLAVADPWPLVRERAVLELGRLSRRLQLETLPGVPSPDEVSSETEVDVAVAQLIRAAKPSLLERRAPDESEALDIDAACDVVATLVLDIEGGRRVLEALEVLMDTGDLSDDFREPLSELARDLTRDLAGQAMARAVRDEAPLVRAAAIESIVTSTGTTVLRQILEQLTRENSPLVLRRVLGLVRTYGFPEHPEDTTPEAARRMEGVWIDVIYSYASQHPDGSVRVAAMRALQSVTEDGPPSLREEDWQSWRIRRKQADAR